MLKIFKGTTKKKIYTKRKFGHKGMNFKKQSSMFLLILSLKVDFIQFQQPWIYDAHLN